MKKVLGFLAIGLTAATNAADTSYHFTAHYVQGEVHAYSIMTGIMGLFPTKKPIGISFGMKYKVLRSAASGNRFYLTYTTPKSGPTKIPLKMKDATITLDRYNRPAQGSHSAQIFAVLPDHSVKVGDKWKGSYNLQLSENAGGLVNVVYKLAGVKIDRGHTIAVLAMDFTGTTTGEGTELVDLKDGAVLVSDIQVKVRNPNPQTMAQVKMIPMEIQVKRTA